jgi:hypothetical protein
VVLLVVRVHAVSADQMQTRKGRRRSGRSTWFTRFALRLAVGQLGDALVRGRSRGDLREGLSKDEAASRTNPYVL